MYLVVKSFESVILISFWSKCYTNRNKFVFAICCPESVESFFAVLVSEFAKFEVLQPYALSSVLSKIFCLLKCSDCIDDIVCTKTGLCESSSLIIIKDRGGLVHPSKHISKCMRVAETTIRHFIDHN